MSKNKIRVLIVDDEKVVRDFLLRLLKLENVESVPVESGAQAIEEMGKGQFELVFLDVRMPGMNGVETLRKLKAIQPQASYIMMTGYAVDDLIEEAKKEGILTSIKKPFDLNQLISFLGIFTDKKELRVLAVDDDDNVLSFFDKLLEKKNIKLFKARTEEECLQLIKSEKLDLVFLDIYLADKSGIDLYKRIHREYPGLNITMMTGMIQEAARLKEQNIEGCLFKPFEIDKIFAEINNAKSSKDKKENA